VLNARRHRGGDQVRHLGIDIASHECSTPEGIEAAISLGTTADTRASTRVLNARRHRGGDQAEVRALREAAV